MFIKPTTQNDSNIKNKTYGLIKKIQKIDKIIKKYFFLNILNAKKLKAQ